VPHSVSSALELIRASTADAHQALERGLRVARADAGDDEYTRYLAAVLGWLEPLERPLWSNPWPVSIGAAERDDKAAWIRADLTARGLTAEEIARIPRVRTLPPLGSLAERFGVAYVIEGAQLGGQVLRRQLGPRVAPRPTRWLESYRDQVGVKWRAFLAALAHSLEERADAEAAARAAGATFEWVHAWFARQRVA
jgi:heme oxygenase